MKDEAYWHSKHPVRAGQFYHGRPLPNSTKRFAMDVRHFIWNDDYVMKGIAYENGLKKENPDEAACFVQNWVVRNLKYVSDEKIGCSEYWLFPGETFKMKQGDCEDGAILIASLLMNIIPPEDYWRVRVSAGLVKTNDVTAPEGGHAYCTYCRTTDNEWVALDWCYASDHDKPVRKKTPLKKKKDYLDVWFSFNHLWAWNHTNFEVVGRIRDIPMELIDELRSQVS